MTWQVQTDKPLFPDLVWDQPQTKSQQPQLLVIGGRSQSLAGPLFLHRQLKTHSRLKVAVPDVWQRQLPQNPGEIVFCPSNQSGGLAGRGLNQLLALAEAADGLIIGGSIGANSETKLLVQNFLDRVDKPTVICDEALKGWPEGQTTKASQIIVADKAGFSQLLASVHLSGRPLGSDDHSQLMELLADSKLVDFNLVVQLGQTTWVKILSNMCYNISATGNETESELIKLAGWVTYLVARFPQQLFEAGVTASYQAFQKG